MALNPGEWTVRASAAVTPDTTHGSSGAWANPANAIDGNSATFAGSSAGGGSASPTYAPAIRFLLPPSAGAPQCVGIQIEYEVIYAPVGGSGGIDAQARVKAILQQYGASPTVDLEAYLNDWGDTAWGPDMAKQIREIRFDYWLPFQTPEQASGTLDNKAWPAGASGVYSPQITIVNQAPFSMLGSVIGVKIYDFKFILKDRHTYHGGSQATC